MTETGNDGSSNGGRSGPEAGLSQTGRTADDFEPGDRTASDYGSPAGLDRAEDEAAEPPGDDEAAG